MEAEVVEAIGSGELVETPEWHGCSRSFCSLGLCDSLWLVCLCCFFFAGPSSLEVLSCCSEVLSGF